MLPFACFVLLVASLWGPLRLATPALIEEPQFYALWDRGVPVLSYSPEHRLRPFDGVVFALGYWLAPDHFRGLSFILMAIFVAKGLLAYQLFRLLIPAHPGLSLLAAGLFVVYPADSGLMLLRMTHVHFALTCGLLAIILLLTFEQRPRLWLIPSMWLAVLLDIGIYEAALPLLLAAPLLLLRFPQRVWTRMPWLCAVWYVPIVAFAAWAVLNARQAPQGTLPQLKFLSSVSWPDLARDGLPAVARAYRWHFWDCWIVALNSLRDHAFALLWGGAVAGAFAGAAWRFERERDGTRDGRRELVIAGLVGLLALGLGYSLFAVLPSHRWLTDRFQYSSLGAALAICAVGALIVRRRALTLVLVAILLAVATAAAQERYRFWVEVKARQDHLLAALVEQAPAFARPDVALIIVDDAGVWSNDYSFQYREVLEYTVRHLYSAPALEVCLCNRGHRYNWGCRLRPGGVEITWNGSWALFPYERVVALRYDLDGELRILDRFPAEMAVEGEPRGYAPRALVAPGPPPRRAATLLSGWPRSHSDRPAVQAHRLVVFEFDSSTVGPGWRGPEVTAEGVSFQWSVDEVASLTASLAADTDVELRLYILASFLPDLANELKILVNHVPVPTTAVAEPGGRYFVRGRVSRQVLARTRLYDRIDVVLPRLAGPGSLGVAVDQLELVAVP